MSDYRNPFKLQNFGYRNLIRRFHNSLYVGMNLEKDHLPTVVTTNYQMLTSNTVKSSGDAAIIIGK
jgi:hypothetical protein